MHLECDAPLAADDAYTGRNASHRISFSMVFSRPKSQFPAPQYPCAIATIFLLIWLSSVHQLLKATNNTPRLMTPALLMRKSDANLIGAI